MRVLFVTVTCLLLICAFAFSVAAQTVLPAPLYWQEYDGQLWRLDADGTTVHQITDEAQPISDFDVSPADGRLVILYDNDLILADADGENRTVLVDGPALPDGGGNLDPLNQIFTPRRSPDGTQIAYGLGGINVLDLTPGETEFLLVNEVPINEPDPEIRMMGSTMYTVEAWSPDGTRLMVTGLVPPESAALIVLDLDTDDWRYIVRPEDGAFGFGYVSWSADSSAIYRAIPNPGFETGLWRSDAATGGTETLIPGAEGAVRNLVAVPQQLGDGLLYMFMTSTDAPDMMNIPALTMFRAAPDGVMEREALREDAHRIAGVLWANDASGAVIVNNTDCDESCPVLWLPTDDSAPVTLPIEARYIIGFRWGKSA